MTTTDNCSVTIGGITVPATSDATWTPQRGWHDHTPSICGGCGWTAGQDRRCPVAGDDQECESCHTATMAIHADGSSTCGTCYIQRGRDLGVI